MKNPASCFPLLAAIVVAFFSVSLPTFGKSTPKTKISLAGERDKETLLGTVRLSGEAWIGGEDYADITDQVWNSAPLVSGKLARQFVVNGITIPTGSVISIVSGYVYWCSIDLEITSPVKFSFGGLTFGEGQNIGITYNDLQSKDGRYLVDDHTPLDVTGTLKENAIINGLPIRKGYLAVKGSHRAFREGNSSGVQLVSGKLSADTTLYGDVHLRNGDDLNYSNLNPSLIDQSNWLDVSYDGVRAIRGFKNVRLFSLDCRTGRTARLVFSKPTMIKGLMAYSVDYHATGAVHEIVPTVDSKWNGMELEGPISFWPDGNAQQVLINPYPSDIKVCQGVKLENVTVLRFDPTGKLTCIHKNEGIHKNEDHWYRVREGSLTPLLEDHPLAAASSYYRWVQALRDGL